MKTLTPRKAVRRMAPYVPPTGNRADKVRLDFNENTVGCSPKVVELLKAQLTPERLSVYPDYSSVKQTLAAYFKVRPDQFTLTNGTDEAIQLLINTYVDAKDHVVIPRPSYAMYRFYSELAGANVKEVDYEAPKFKFPLEKLLDQIDKRTRAVLISNPNNPTGSWVLLPAIEKILKAAEKAVVLIDEAYFEFNGVTALPWLEKFPNLFVSRTFSKVYGMAAMRIGCLFSSSANVAYLQKAQSPYSVNMLAALAAEAAVADHKYADKYVAEALAARDLLYKGLDKLGIPYVPSAANFVLTNMGERALEVRDALREHAILVRDRSYEIPGGVRITFGTRAQTRLLLRQLRKIWT